MEALRLVALLRRQARDALDDNSRETFGDCQVVGGRQRPRAQLLEREPGDVAAGARHNQRSRQDRQRHAADRGVVGQIGEGGFERRPRRRVVRPMIDFPAAHPGQPVVAAAVELDPVEPLPEQCDERQEAVTLQPVFIQAPRWPVRRRDDNGAGLEQRAKQPLDDHRIGDVVDLELVEAQQRRLGGEIGRDLGDGLVGVGAALMLDALMHIEHEGVEMDPPLLVERGRGEEQIHQHRFAAPDRSPQIDPTGRRVGPLAEPQPVAPAAPPVLRPVMPQLIVQLLQPGDDALLRRVGMNRALLDPVSVQRRRTAAVRFGGGSRQGRSRSGKIDGHRWQEARERKRGPERPRPRSTSPGPGSAMVRRAQSAATATASRRAAARALPTNKRLASHSPETSTSTSSGRPASISMP